MRKKVRIAFADERKIFVSALENIISTGEHLVVKYIVDNVHTLSEITKLVDVVIIGSIKMKNFSGYYYEAIKQLNPDCKVIVIKDVVSCGEIKEAIKNGVDAYLLKDAEIEDLFNAISGVMSGKLFLCNGATQLLLQQEKENNGSKLTRREREVLIRIASGSTNSETANALFISESTVDFHRKNIYQKLDIINTVGLVKCAIKEGLISLE